DESWRNQRYGLYGTKQFAKRIEKYIDKVRFHMKPKGEKMKTKTTIILVLTFIVIGLVAGLLLWDQLPEQMSSHWNANDEVDGFTTKFWGVFLMPLITLGMFGLFLILPNIDPLKANIAQFRPIFNL